MNIDLIPDPTQKYVETTGFSMCSDGVCIENYCIIFDRKKGIKIPLLTPDARLYYQLIPKDLLIVMLKTYLPEINSMAIPEKKKAKVVIKRKRKIHK